MARIRTKLGRLTARVAGTNKPVNPWRQALTYYVSATGSDATDGAITRPWATWLKAAASGLPAAGRLGLGRGGTYAAAGVGLTGAGAAVIATGTGAAPVLDGGQNLISWAPYTAQATTPNIVPSGSYETSSSDSRNAFPGGWTAFSAGGSYVLKETAKVPAGVTAAVKLAIAGGSCQAAVTTTQTLAAGVDHVLTFSTASDTAGFEGYYQVTETATGKYLQPDGTTWSDTVSGFSLAATHVDTNYQVVTRTLRVPVEAAITLVWKRAPSAPNGNHYIGKVSVAAASPAPTVTNLYRHAFAGSGGILTKGTQWLLTGVDPDRLPNGRWIIQGGYLYVRDDAAAPAGYRISTVDTYVAVTGTDALVSGLEVRMSRKAPIYVNGARAVVQDVRARLCGDQLLSGGNGAISVGPNAADSIVRRVKLTDCGTDALYLTNGPRVTFEDFETVMAWGSAADAIQLDYTDTAARQAAYPVVRYGRMDQRNTPSPKGSLVQFGDHGTFEHLWAAGGHFGVADNGSYGVTQHCIATEVDGYGFGVAGNSPTTVGYTVQDSLAFACVHGVRIWTAACTQVTMARLTLVTTSAAARSDFSALTGSLTDSILWAPNRASTEPVLNFEGTAPSGFTVARCIIGPEIPGVPLVRWNGTDYATLAAWQTASGKGSGCSAADPQFTSGPSHAYDLAAGSPARTMGAGGSRIGCPSTIVTGPRVALPA